MITRLTQDDLTDSETAKCSKAGDEKVILIGATLMVSRWINAMPPPRRRLAVDRTVAVWADHAKYFIAILMRQSSLSDGQNVKTRGGNVLLDNILSAVEKTGVDMATIERTSDSS